MNNPSVLVLDPEVDAKTDREEGFFESLDELFNANVNVAPEPEPANSIEPLYAA